MTSNTDSSGTEIGNTQNGNTQNGNPEDDDNVSAGEQVLDEGHVTPNQDDFLDADHDDDRSGHDADGGSQGDAHAADERTDPGAPPAQGDPG